MDREIAALLGAILAVAVIVAGVLGCGLSRTVDDLKDSNAKISANTKRIKRVLKRVEGGERRDVISVRRAATRICARQNLERAEIHAAYQRPIVLLSPFSTLVKSEPVLELILKGQETLRKSALKRVHRFLPILDCAPNLKGKPAVARPPALQSRFVKLYLEGRLDPTPDFEAVKNGPEERGR